MIISEDFLEQLEKEVLSTYKINWTNFVDIIFEFPIWSLMKKKEGKKEVFCFDEKYSFFKMGGTVVVFSKNEKGEEKSGNWKTREESSPTMLITREPIS